MLLNIIKIQIFCYVPSTVLKVLRIVNPHNSFNK